MRTKYPHENGQAKVTGRTDSVEKIGRATLIDGRELEVVDPAGKKYRLPGLRGGVPFRYVVFAIGKTSGEVAWFRRTTSTREIDALFNNTSIARWGELVVVDVDVKVDPDPGRIIEILEKAIQDVSMAGASESVQSFLGDAIAAAAGPEASNG